MLKITREEKDMLLAILPDERIVRTSKQRGRHSGSYYCTERPAVKNALRKIRKGAASNRKETTK